MSEQQKQQPAVPGAAFVCQAGEQGALLVAPLAGLLGPQPGKGRVQVQIRRVYQLNHGR